MPILCFKSDSVTTGHDEPTSPPTPHRHLGTGIKELLKGAIHPTVVPRDSLVVNMGFTDGPGSLPLPALAEDQTMEPPLPSGMQTPPRGFVRLSSMKSTSSTSPLLHPSSGTSMYQSRDFAIAEDQPMEIDMLPQVAQPPATSAESEVANFTPTPSAIVAHQAPGNPKRILNWTQSRKALAVLMVKEELISKKDQDIHSLSHAQRLEERLQRLNLDMQTMAGDGNCQFRTLAYQLFGSQEYHMAVRKRVIQHIRDHRDEYECFLGDDFERYLESMSRPGTWGDELTLRAACDAYGVVTNVVTSDAQHWFLTYEPHETKSPGELFLTYIAPVHYNSIKRNSSLRTLSKQLTSSFKKLGSARWTEDRASL